MSVDSTIILQIGPALREMREAVGMTLADAADATGLFPTAISQIELSHVEPLTSTVLNLLAAYGCRLEIVPRWKGWLS